MLLKLCEATEAQVKKMSKNYTELLTLPTFLERFRYLKCNGVVGNATFGFERYLNQSLYRSPEWKKFRRDIILRDKGCDLGCEGFEIFNHIIIHHMEPITVEDVLNRNPMIFDPENVISVSLNTHNAIHYGDEELLITMPIERTKNDTCPWRRI